jgi:hypothetical protein
MSRKNKFNKQRHNNRPWHQNQHSHSHGTHQGFKHKSHNQKFREAMQFQPAPLFNTPKAPTGSETCSFERMSDAEA